MARKVIRKEQEKDKKLHEALLEHINKKLRAQWFASDSVICQQQVWLQALARAIAPVQIRAANELRISEIAPNPE